MNPKYDGNYVLLTSEEVLPKEEIALIYRQLTMIEQSLRSLKSLHDLVPMFHYRDDRIKAHVFLCVLLYFLERLMEKRATKVELKGREYQIRTDVTLEITEIFEALHYQMRPRSQLLLQSAPAPKFWTPMY